MLLRASAKLLAASALLAAAQPALATETITYVYDAKGRLVQVVRSGTVNNGVQTVYQYDDTDNRTNAQTTGSSN